MIKRLLVAVLALSFCGIVSAQEPQDPWVWPDQHIQDALYLHVGLGPKIGGGLAMATTPSFFDFDLKSRFAYQGGVAFNVNISHHSSLGLLGIGRWGLDVEVLYEARSFKAGNETLMMNYMEIPVLLQFYLAPEFHMEAGLTPTKLINISPDNLQSGNVVANMGGIKGDDVMISAGACFKTPFNLVIGLRYNLGISEWAENFHSKTSTVMASFNYLFPLIK